MGERKDAKEICCKFPCELCCNLAMIVGIIKEKVWRNRNAKYKAVVRFTELYSCCE